jgi:copper chaperone NosL
VAGRAARVPPPRRHLKEIAVRHALARFYDFLDRPIAMPARLVLVALVVPLLLSFSEPLWRISLTAPQYPSGLYMEIYAHRLDGGHGGHDIKEINNLNHYIGMHAIDRAELSELDWMPFAIIALALLALRCAAIGNVRMLIDLAVITGFIATYSMGRFAYRLYVYGHNLDPAAPLTIDPFTPAIFGTKQIANFATTSYPQLGTALLGTFIVGVAAVTLYHLVAGRLAASRLALAG